MEVAKRITWITLFLIVGVTSHWLPHRPNFSAFLAIALFAGFVLPSPTAMVVSIATVFLGDLLVGFHDLMWVVYLSLLPMVWVGSKLPSLNGKGWLAWGLTGLAAASFFFLTTNLAVWWTSGMYPHSEEGLVECFVLAIPFFHNSILATWLYTAGFEGVRRLFPARFPVKLISPA